MINFDGEYDIIDCKKEYEQRYQKNIPVTAGYLISYILLRLDLGAVWCADCQPLCCNPTNCSGGIQGTCTASEENISLKLSTKPRSAAPQCLFDRANCQSCQSVNVTTVWKNAVPQKVLRKRFYDAGAPGVAGKRFGIFCGCNGGGFTISLRTSSDSWLEILQ